MRLRDIEDLTLVNTTYENKTVLEEVNLAYVPWENNSMINAFTNCINLTSVTCIDENVANMANAFAGCRNLQNSPNIPNNVTDMSWTFRYCINLNNITEIPTNVINMCGTFSDCHNLVNSPIIPNSVNDISAIYSQCWNLQNIPDMSNLNDVTNMSQSFLYCSNLVNAPVIPNNVTDLSFTFYNCYNIVNAPVIPNNVINMSGTFMGCNNIINAPDLSNCINLFDVSGLFQGCSNLQGDIIIESERITSAGTCFYNTPSEKWKNVFIPFRYENSMNTTTYNAFMDAGYSSEYRVNGALLMDGNQGYWRYDVLQNNTKLLYEWIGKETTIWAIKRNSLFNNYGYDVAMDISTSESNTPFYNNPRVEVAELEFVPWVNDSMAYAFYNAVNVVAIHNIHYNVTNFHKAFWNCRYLTDITIPAMINDITDAFVGTNVTNVTYVNRDGSIYVPDPTDITTPPYNASGSYSKTPIKTTPNLPGSTNDLSWAFEDCYELENTSMLPQGAVNMQGTFYNCYNLREYKDITSNVIEDVSMCFYNCTNLTHPGKINPNATNMYRTYYNCVNMQFIPNIPDNVVNMQETYYNCQTVTSVPNVPGNVVNMEGTFDGCVNVGGDINIISEVVTNAYNCFNNTTTQKNIYIPYYYENGELSATYNAFLEAGYINETPINGVLMHDMYYDPELEEWRYQSIANREKILYEYLGESLDISVPTNKTYLKDYNSELLLDMPFYNKNYNSVNLRNVRFVNNSMDYAFYNCRNLTKVNNINQNVTNMVLTFYNCFRLDNAPVIPDGVTNMSGTFSYTGIKNAPIIPNSVTDMSDTFATSGLINAPVIPNSVENMVGTFVFCSNIVNAPVIPNSVTNMFMTFAQCSGLKGTVLIRSNQVINAEMCFSDYGSSLNKDVYIPFTYENGVNTITYESFINAGYKTTERVNGVLLYDYTPELYDWLFTPLSNGYTSLYKYVGNNIDVVVPNNNTVINTIRGLFYGKNVNSVDMNNVPCENNSMEYAFYGCSNLVNVTNINQNVTNMTNTFAYCTNLVNATDLTNCINLTSLYGTFYACYNLVNVPVIPNSVTNMGDTFAYCSNLVNAPEIPNNVTYMGATFWNCYNLINVPVIPNSVTNMTYAFSNCNNLVNAPEIPNSVIDMVLTFKGCKNLVNAPVIPNNVTNMYRTFMDCTNLVNATEIPNSVTNMSDTFAYCSNLSGDIIIYSNQIRGAEKCFTETSLDKNVYIPFYYSNGMVSATYNAFISAGYSETERKDGVLLKKLKNYNVDFDGYIITNNGADIELQKYEGSESIIVTPHLYY